MKQFHGLRVFPAVFLLLALIASPVSAFTVSSTDISPPGYQAAGTSMTVNAVIDFFSRANETFPAANGLHLSTGLGDPRWAGVLVLNGVETRLPPATGGSSEVPGYYLSYPRTETMQLKVTLTGTIPADTSPGQDILKIQETDPDNTVVSTAHLEMPAAPPAPVTPQSTPTKIPTTRRIFTPIPTATPTQASPVGMEAGIIAALGAGLACLKRK
jgi:hypothetical protein